MVKMKKRKVYLFQPGEKTEFAPLPNSLLPLAATLKKAGYAVDLVDTRIRDYTKLELKDALCCGITSFTGSQLNHALKIAEFIRSRDKKIPIIWGGIHASLLPKQTAEHPLVDIVVKGEGEETLLELAEKLEKKESIEEVKGILFKKNGKVIQNPERPFMDMNKVPFYPFEFLNLKRYAKDTVSLQSSRGCPHNCAFCFNQNYNKFSWRQKKPETVVEEIEAAVKKTGIKFVAFNDDNFFVDPNRVKEIAKGIIERKLEIEWSGMCRAEYIARWDNEMFSLLKKSGLKNLGIGVESGSQKILDMVNKGTKVEDNLTAIRRCGEAGITPISSFMIGFPDETEEDLRETLEFVDKMTEANPKAKSNGIFVFTPYPGTRLYEEALKRGFREPNSLEEWGKSYFSDTAQSPWLEKGYAKKLETISSIGWLLFDNPAKLRLSAKQMVKYVLKAILLASARARWRLKFFSFPVEWKVYGMVSREMR